MLRRSLSNIKDCSTAGSESNGPTDFTSSHRVVPPAVPGDDAVRRPSAATSVGIASAHISTSGRPRIARRPMTDTLPERPTTSRTTHGESLPVRPQRRSCSLDSKKSATRQCQALSAAALLTESSQLTLHYGLVSYAIKYNKCCNKINVLFCFIAAKNNHCWILYQHC